MDPVLVVRPNLMVGPGVFLNPQFVWENKITHVINVGEPAAAPPWVPAAFKQQYLSLPIADDDKTRLEDVYPAFEQALLRFIRDPGSRVYVHCMAGMNRSASLTVMFLVKQFRLPLEAVVFHALRQRPCVLANPFFNAQLVEFAKKHAHT
jgi:atypical dual specificity phosphatase